MITKQVKHIYGNGAEQSFIRLIADSGKVLTNDNGETVWNCIDVTDVVGWTEIDAPLEEGNFENEDDELTDSEIIELLEGII